MADRCSPLRGNDRETPEQVLTDLDETLGLRQAPRARAGRMRRMMPGGEYVPIRSSS